LNDYVLSVLLGIVEGLTEFLPISSTAHLRIVEKLLLPAGWSSGYWKMYTIVIQLGAILTLPIYFRGRIGKFLSTFPSGNRGDLILEITGTATPMARRELAKLGWIIVNRSGLR